MHSKNNAGMYINLSLCIILFYVNVIGLQICLESKTDKPFPLILADPNYELLSKDELKQQLLEDEEYNKYIISINKNHSQQSNSRQPKPLKEK